MNESTGDIRYHSAKVNFTLGRNERLNNRVRTFMKLSLQRDKGFVGRTPACWDRVAVTQIVHLISCGSNHNDLI